MASCPQKEWAAGASAIQPGVWSPLSSSSLALPVLGERAVSVVESHRGSRAEASLWERNVSGGVLASPLP